MFSSPLYLIELNAERIPRCRSYKYNIHTWLLILTQKSTDQVKQLRKKSIYINNCNYEHMKVLIKVRISMYWRCLLYLFLIIYIEKDGILQVLHITSTSPFHLIYVSVTLWEYKVGQSFNSKIFQALKTLLYEYESFGFTYKI